MLGASSYLVADRFVYLNVKRDINSFFERSLNTVHNTATFQIRQGVAYSEAEKQKHEEILLRSLRPAYGIDSNLEEHPVRYLFNFFGNEKNTLQGYGLVTHAHVPAKPTVSGATRVWFVVSAGPSGVDVELEESTESDDIHKYVINSIPYHITNGIRSVGYLYQDTNGVRVGHTPLVGVKK